MRVLYDGTPLFNPLTGVGHYTRALLEHLLALDRDLEVVLVAVSMRPADFSRVPRHERVRLRHIRFPARIAVRAGRPTGEPLVGRAHLFHGTNYWVPPLRRARGIVTVHDLTFWFHPEWCTLPVRRYRTIVPRVLRRCALALVPSATIRAQLSAEMAFPSERIVVTPEGIRDLFWEARPDPALERRLGIAGPYLLFVGTLEPRKNLERLLRAVAVAGEGLRLVLAGSAGWGELDLRADAARLGIEERVVLPGYLPDTAIASLMAGCRAFVFPSLYEGFGLPPLEAIAAGAPVVASRSGSLAEVLGDAPFWCDPADVESIADAIRRAAGDEEARIAAVEEGRRHAARYRWEETARLTLAAYRRALDGA